METPLHRLVMSLLIELLELFWADRTDFYVGGNMFFYFSALQSKQNDFRGPDFFVVLDTERRDRDSWVVWEEGGQLPNFVLEITSASTETVDRNDKMRLYEKLLRIPEYFLYDPRTSVLEGYRLGRGRIYEPIQKTPEGRLPSDQLGLHLGVQESVYMNRRARFVRFYTTQGQLVPSAQEQRDEAERQKSEAERHAAQLVEQLKAYERRFGPLPGGPGVDDPT